MALTPEFFRGITAFDWDEGNLPKVWQRHTVTRVEAEQVFFNRPLVVSDASKHSVEETRYFALGRTDGGRQMAVVFMFRGSLLRVISARPMSRKERLIYAETEKN